MSVAIDTFFGKFGELADDVEAVPKLRALLIDSAIHGLLVKNDPADKAVSLLAPPRKVQSLPLNWRTGSLGEAFSFEYGDNLPKPKRSETGEVPVYGSNGIVGTHNKALTEEPSIIVGRKGSAGALNLANGPSWTTDVAYYVTPSDEIDLRYTFYLFTSLRLDELGKGIKPGLSRKEEYTLPINLPPLAEQRRIVAKVDQLMALVDEWEARLTVTRTTATHLLDALVAELTSSAKGATPSQPGATPQGKSRQNF
ncbi:MAG: restriction endonuclease subunit S [Luteolibacter sp.]